MKRSWTALAVALISILAVAGCNDYGNTFQANTGAQVTFLSPSNISAGSPDFILTINGSGFVKQTYVTWNGKKLNTTVTLDSTLTVVTLVTAAVPAALVAKPGTATVLTQNPFSGAGNNGLSNPVTFIINPPPNPLPTLTSISPTTIAACGTSCTNLTLDLQGSNFITSSDPTQVSQVRWTAGATQTTLATTSVTATDIKATVPGSLISAAGTAMVTVFNPPAPQVTPPGGTPLPSSGGGGTTTAQTFTITAASGALTHAAAASQTVVEETPAVSADGRYVAYTASNNQHAQIFVRDTCEGAAGGCKAQTTLVSAASDGSAANDDSSSPSISANGRYVAFSSAASNLVENAPAGHQIYLRDTCGGAEASCSPSTQIVSIDSSGGLTGTESSLPSISASGRFVAFVAVTQSHSSQPVGIVPGATNSGYRQVFVRDTCLGASSCTPKTSRISLQSGDGTPSAAKPAGPAMGANGQSIALAGQNATLFTRSVPIDDRVFLAITNSAQ
jgi:WD40-like Beta Propeller Repeat